MGQAHNVVALAKTDDLDPDPLGGFVYRQQGDKGVVPVNNHAVDLVGDHSDAIGSTDLHQTLQLLPGKDPACGIVWIHHQKDCGVVGLDLGLKAGEVQLVAAVHRLHGVFDHAAAGPLHRPGDGRKDRGLDDNCVPGPGIDAQGHPHRPNGAGNTAEPLPLHRQAKLPTVPVNDPIVVAVRPLAVVVAVFLRNGDQGLPDAGGTGKVQVRSAHADDILGDAWQVPAVGTVPPVVQGAVKIIIHSHPSFPV